MFFIFYKVKLINSEFTEILFEIKIGNFLDNIYGYNSVN